MLDDKGDEVFDIGGRHFLWREELNEESQACRAKDRWKWLDLLVSTEFEEQMVEKVILL